MIYARKKGQVEEPIEVQREKYRNHWVIRTVGDKHICNNLSLFNNFQRGHFGNYDDCYGSTPIEGIGSVDLKVKDHKGNVVVLKLREVLYIPKWNRNQLSLFALRGSFQYGVTVSNLILGKVKIPATQNEHNIPVITTIDLVEINV